MKLVDVDALDFSLDGSCTDEAGEAWDNGAEYIIDIVKNAVPHNGSVPVVHARWDCDCDDYVCSACKAMFSSELGYVARYEIFVMPNYCPRCGAKMDQED